MPDNIKIYDRIKELTYTTGLGNIQLAGPVNGFSSFDSRYVNNDNLFYAITDGQNYEVGSGVFVTGVYDEIIRFPIRSSNGDSAVNFIAGTKEIYATYPATHAVLMGSGIDGFNFPQDGGIAYWSQSNILNYDSDITWDSSNKRLGIINTSPSYGIEIGGDGRQSSVGASGFYVGTSGIFFPAQNNGDSSYVGGRQLIHFEANQLDQYAYDNALLDHLTGTDSVFELSGVVNEYILFKEQNAGLFLAGPASGCSPPCSPGYPSFRSITCEDVPCIEEVSGILRNDLVFVSGITQDSLDVSGVLRNDLTIVSGIAQNASDASGILQTDLNFISGVAIYASGEVDYAIKSKPLDYSPASGNVSGIYNAIFVDQAAYNSLTKDPNTLYFIS